MVGGYGPPLPAPSRSLFRRDRFNDRVPPPPSTRRERYSRLRDRCSHQGGDAGVGERRRALQANEPVQLPVALKNPVRITEGRSAQKREPDAVRRRGDREDRI